MISTTSDFYDSAPAVAALPAGYVLLKGGDEQAKACLWWNFGTKTWERMAPGFLSGTFHHADGTLLARFT